MTTPPIGLGPSTSEYTEGVTVTAWPKPEVAGHEVPAEYLGKKAVIDMARYAERFGWNVRVTHAKGSYPSIGGRPGPARDSLALRMWKGDRRAVAVYVAGNKSWDWKILRIWMVSSFPLSIGLLAAFEAALAHDPESAIVES